MSLSKLPNEIIIETVNYLNDREVENLQKSNKKNNELCNNNKEYINKIRYDKSQIQDIFENASCLLQQRFILTIDPNGKNKDKLSKYKFNDNLCICGKIINYCKIYFELTFIYHRGITYSKFFKIKLCSRKCCDKFVHENHGNNYPSSIDEIYLCEQKNKNNIYCVKKKYLYSGNEFVKIKNFKYRYNNYVISLQKIQDEAFKYFRNRL